MQSDNSSLCTHHYMIELESENFQKLNAVIPHSTGKKVWNTPAFKFTPCAVVYHCYQLWAIGRNCCNSSANLLTLVGDKSLVLLSHPERFSRWLITSEAVNIASKCQPQPNPFTDIPKSPHKVLNEHSYVHVVHTSLKEFWQGGDCVYYFLIVTSQFLRNKPVNHTQI